MFLNSNIVPRLTSVSVEIEEVREVVVVRPPRPPEELDGVRPDELTDGPPEEAWSEWC